MNFFLNHLDLNIHATINKITLIIILGSIPHQKFCCYHLPTRGRAGIKLGNAWYVSNVSIIFDCSMLLYYPFWMFMGFTLHFYIIFGTNLLTGGPTRIIVCFAYFRVSQKRNTKRNETFTMIFLGPKTNQKTWSWSLELHEAATTQEGAPRGWAHPLPHGFLVASLTCTPSPLDCFRSKNNSPEGFIPFGFRLIFLFCETLK